MNRTWNEWFWLPENYTWKDFESEERRYPDVGNFFLWVILVGSGFLLFRNLVLIPYIFRPIGIRAGVRCKPYRAPTPNEDLEVLYKINRARPPRHMLLRAASKIGWSERKVERWLRQKALSIQMTTLDKFEDFGWQFVYYASFFIAGLCVVVVKPYYKDPYECWRNFPFDRVTPDVWWYSVVGCAFYVAQIIILLGQDPRHDFYQMIAHHVITLFNFYFCWSLNAVRMLTITVFMHEIADIPLAFGKLWSYAGYHKIAECFVYTFGVVWIGTRIIMFPIYGLIPTYYAPTTMKLGNFPGFFLGQLFDYSLLVLHIIWTWELVVSIKRKVSGADKFARDLRSSPEELSEDETETKKDTLRTQINGEGNLQRRNTNKSPQ